MAGGLRQNAEARGFADGALLAPWARAPANPVPQTTDGIASARKDDVRHEAMENLTASESCSRLLIPLASL